MKTVKTNRAIFKQNYTLKLFIPFKMAILAVLAQKEEIYIIQLSSKKVL